MKLTWLGHSAFHLEIAGASVLIDPFVGGNGKYPHEFEAALERVDIIALTHGHADHLGDTVRLAQKYDCSVVAIHEVCQYLGTKGLTKFQPMNIGGSIEVAGIRISMVHAQHTSTIFVDGQLIPLGDAAGLVFAGGDHTVYHAGDTGLFSDMALIQRLHKPTIGLLPIGDRFTMGPEAAAIACNEFLELDYIIPTHWGTFPPLVGKPETFEGLVKRGKVVLPEPGKTISF